jgi:hypothetical protein
MLAEARARRSRNGRSDDAMGATMEVRAETGALDTEVGL